MPSSKLRYSAFISYFCKSNHEEMNIKKTTLLVLLAVCCSFHIQAKEVLPDDSTRVENTEKTDEPKENKKKEAAKKKTSDYEMLLKKGGSMQQGMFTVRHIEDKWYFEIPDSMVGKMLLAVTRYAFVPQNFGVFSGEEVSRCTLYFEQRDPKTMLLRAYVLSQEADEHSRIATTLKFSSADPIAAAFKIIGRNKKTHAQLIDVTPLFKKDNNLLSIPKTAASKLKLGTLAENRTFIDTIKTYPINTEIATTRTYNVNAGRVAASRTGSITLGLNTSIVMLPDVPMRKRLWDERVGYFINRFTHFTDDQHKTERESFVSRYRLVPKDLKRYLKGELVEPVKPIVYYIDPATPKQWVPYLMQGVNDWNVAFESAGFKNAIIAKEWNPQSGFSMDDARFSVLRYLPSETENAYGPRIVDPRSGEIIESHIGWYHNVMNLLTKWYMVQCAPLDPRARKMQFDEKLMGELIRFVSSHEVGHSLGLRHNMGASYATPVEKLRDKAWVEANGHTASIMDYARFNYVAQPEDGITERGLFPRINDYDKWAIRWGYSYRPEFKDEYEEKEKLREETTRTLAANPRLWFGGEGRNEDPRAQTEDLGDDNVKASDYGIKNLKRVIKGLPQWTQQTDGRHTDLREMYLAVIKQYNRYNNHVIKNLGGRYINNMPGRKPFEQIPAARSRAAMDYLSRQLFTAPVWLYPDEITSMTGTDAANDIQTKQETALSTLMAASLLNSINNASLASPEAYRLDDYMQDLFHAVWKPLSSPAELVNKSRRALQRNYIANLDKLLHPSEKERTGAGAKAYRSDARLYALQQLDQIDNYARSQLKTATGLNALHYRDILQLTKQVRTRQTDAR